MGIVGSMNKDALDRQPTTPVIGAPSGARVSWAGPLRRLQSRSWTSFSFTVCRCERVCVSYGQLCP